MAVYSGTVGTVKSGGGSSTTTELKEWSLDLGLSVVDVSSFGDVWNENIPGIRNFSGSFSGNYDDTDLGVNYQNRIIEPKLSDTINFRLYAGATYYFLGTAVITGESVGIGFDGAATVTYSFTGESDIVYTNA